MNLDARAALLRGRDELARIEAQLAALDSPNWRPSWWTPEHELQLMASQVQPAALPPLPPPPTPQGTIISSTMHSDGHIEVNINRDGLLVDEEKHEVRVVKD